mmetsp:Transcript_3160/g.4627  ORF Transcript_3160/g.4627 Transcript_3160/m.4627 type:complete len:207 (-) Transcript_3160:56-676(-)|eukprot:CAMPEP_0203675128 /NCGR_PEP_ID=MMETSP0090-20130426/18933_1 /ASSEMBLY_ACC=CAM_ASM_001088 /TAXON_ID=426623 /ORGANISM="Chaetoceros affinis, Strain CCMP159" /LENGTH=206 /DNA_ID=CAMNT_0050541203 /DNA_START=352 /DNA_END=972 /DNA_ORIENTATION=+
MSFSLSTSSSTPPFKGSTCPPLIFVFALVTYELDAADDMNTLIFGPNGNGANPFTSLEANAIFASSASRVDLKEPSPNLFSAPRGGNSHSISGILLPLGFFLIAALIASIAWLSLSLFDFGIDATEPLLLPDPKLNMDKATLSLEIPPPVTLFDAVVLILPPLCCILTADGVVKELTKPHFANKHSFSRSTIMTTTYYQWLILQFF